MEELNRRRATVFEHPLQPACCTNVVPGVPDVVVEYATETSRTVASLLTNHTTVRFPNIRFVFSHGGGAVPFLTFRFSRMVSGDPELMRAERGGGAGPAAILRHGAGVEPVRAAGADAGRPRAVRLGFPAASPLDTANGLAVAGLSPEALARIGRGNALAILPGLA